MLNQGEKQFVTGESESPVTRVESILTLLAVAIHDDLSIFKVDIALAFMRTPMVADIKHKWVRLEKNVVNIILEL